MAERAFPPALLLTLVLALGACSAKPVVAPAEFPAPVLRTVPVRMGLYMDAALRNYTHVDKPDKGATQQVSVGPASQALFSEFLRAQFVTLVPLTQAPSAQAVAPGVQAVLQPVIEEVQIATPSGKDAFHEAWIKYRLRLLASDGRELTTWDLSAYGKARGAALGGSNAAPTAAVREAMRDAAAGMALIFRNGEAFNARLAAATAREATPGPAP